MHENPLLRPSPTDVNGRSDAGKFAAGNRFGTGNPHKGRVQKLRSALLEAVTEADISAIAKSLVQAAKDGDILASKLLLERCLGKFDPGQDEVVERDRENSISRLIEMMQARKAERQAHNAE